MDMPAPAVFDALHNHDLAQRLAGRLQDMNLPPVRFMEVCGTHTMAIARYGLRSLMPSAITLTSGPGCPVCVTSTADIDLFIAATRVERALITTFGDLIKVPGSRSSLKQEMAKGADVRVVYSPLDALKLAAAHPEREVIFLGVGFETTTPTVAAAILTARAQGLANFSVVSSHKTMPQALEALAGDHEIRIDGLICPGHVSVITGSGIYQPMVEKYRIPCVIAGFEPNDILQAVNLLSDQIQEGRPRVEIAYQRAVTETGNARAREVMAEVFTPADAAWRGLGVIPGSGLAIREEFSCYDAVRRFNLQADDTREPAGCRCGEVLKGLITPADCKLFGRACTPDHATGPCMVSSEGACAAFFRYGDGRLPL